MPLIYYGYDSRGNTTYLKGKAAKNLDKLVREGLRKYERGETIKAPSLKEALTIYGGKKNKKY